MSLVGKRNLEPTAWMDSWKRIQWNYKIDVQGPAKSSKDIVLSKERTSQLQTSLQLYGTPLPYWFDFSDMKLVTSVYFQSNYIQKFHVHGNACKSALPKDVLWLILWTFMGKMQRISQTFCSKLTGQITFTPIVHQLFRNFTPNKGQKFYYMPWRKVWLLLDITLEIKVKNWILCNFTWLSHIIRAECFLNSAWKFSNDSIQYAVQ